MNTEYAIEQLLKTSNTDHVFENEWKNPYEKGSEPIPAYIIGDNPNCTVILKNGDEIICGNGLAVTNDKDIRPTLTTFFVDTFLGCLAIKEKGHNAVYVSKFNIDEILERLNKLSPVPTVIAQISDIELRNKVNEELKECCIDISDSSEENLQGGYKSIFESYTEGHTDFEHRLNASVRKGVRTAKQRDSMVRKFNIVNSNYRSGKMTHPTKTHIEKLDQILGGGFYPGIITIGAGTGAGKTTLSLNIAYKIAASGKQVLYFSLEMPEEQLITKILSCQTFQRCRNPQIALTVNDICFNKPYPEQSSDIRENYDRAVEDVKSVIESIKVISNYTAGITIEEVIADIRKYAELYNNDIVVFIDYLQIIVDKDHHIGEKELIRDVIYKLKTVSNNYNIPIICISSLSRTSYESPISTKSFKETGAIEYTSDVLIGIQPTGIFDKNDVIDKNRKTKIECDQMEGKPVKTDIIILKNRTGSLGTVTVDFTVKFSYVADTTKIQTSIAPSASKTISAGKSDDDRQHIYDGWDTDDDR